MLQNNYTIKHVVYLRNTLWFSEPFNAYRDKHASFTRESNLGVALAIVKY